MYCANRVLNPYGRARETHQRCTDPLTDPHRSEGAATDLCMTPGHVGLGTSPQGILYSPVAPVHPETGLYCKLHTLHCHGNSPVCTSDRSKEHQHHRGTTWSCNMVPTGGVAAVLVMVGPVVGSQALPQTVPRETPQG